jgi:hypothetical protein
LKMENKENEKKEEKKKGKIFGDPIAEVQW